MSYELKYLKYKKKYLSLKNTINQNGGSLQTDALKIGGGVAAGVLTAGLGAAAIWHGKKKKMRRQSEIAVAEAADVVVHTKKTARELGENGVTTLAAWNTAATTQKEVRDIKNRLQQQNRPQQYGGYGDYYDRLTAPVTIARRAEGQIGALRDEVAEAMDEANVNMEVQKQNAKEYIDSANSAVETVTQAQQALAAAADIQAAL